MKKEIIDVVNEISWSGVHEMIKNHFSSERDLVIHLHQHRAIELVESVKKQYPLKASVSPLNPLNPFTYNGIKVKPDYPFYNEVILTDERLVQKRMDEAIQNMR